MPRRTIAGSLAQAGRAGSARDPRWDTPGRARQPACTRRPGTAGSRQLCARRPAPARGGQPADRRGCVDRKIGSRSKRCLGAVRKRCPAGRPEEHRVYGHAGQLRPRPGCRSLHRHEHPDRDDRRNAAIGAKWSQRRCKDGWTSWAKRWGGLPWLFVRTGVRGRLDAGVPIRCTCS